MKPDYDLCVIGGGINGTGIARDAAGRGLSVLLIDAQDIAQGTSSASTKLIHGGIRYLEQGEFRLVRESLKEREILLNAAPHIVRPMDFVMPHVKGLRAKWMISVGLWFYDHLAGRKKLSASSSVSLYDSLLGEPLQKAHRDGFRYADCWTDDARLVALNAIDAKARGAEVLTRTACMNLSTMHGTGLWYVQLKDLKSGDEFQISAKMVVNAAGPWVRGILEASDLTSAVTPKVRLVKGSHIVLPRLYEGEHAYIFQQPDKRVVFAIPFEEDFTLIGTTEEAFEGDAAKPSISVAERDYLCAAVNRFFERMITPQDIVWTFSGVRALLDDGEGDARKVTRDYRLELDTSFGAPLLSVFGGKLTTYRSLAQAAVDKITGAKNNSGWTEKAPLPGGDIPNGDMAAFIAKQAKAYPFLPPEVLDHYASCYGTRMDMIMKGAKNLKALGRDFGGGLFEAEIRYLIDHEFVKLPEDILWRRTKYGILLEKKTILALEAAWPDYAVERKVAS